MRQQATDVAAAIDRVGAARGAPEDTDWARRVAAALLIADVLEARVVEVLEEAAAQVSDAGEPAQTLLGDPDEWVAEHRSRWREEGTVQTAAPTAVRRDLVIETFIIASLYSGLFFVYELITWSWRDPFTLAGLAAPLALAVTSRAVEATFTAARARRSHTGGVIAGVLVGAVGVGVTAGTFAVGNGVVLGSRAPLVALGAMVGYGLLAWIVAQLWREQPRRAGTHEPLSDDEWLATLGSALRSRGDMTDARIATVLTEAKEHAQDAGTSLPAEFGPPRAYAQRFDEDRAVRARRTAWLTTAGAVGVLSYNVITVLDGTPSIWDGVWLLVSAIIAALSWRTVREVR